MRICSRLAPWILLSLLGCGSKQAAAPAEHVPPPVPEAPTPPPRPEENPVRILSDIGLKVPESAIYDPDQDVYFVSNINGTPTDKDDNGFISKVSPDGTCDNHFIEGTKSEISLNAPKGLALQGGLLYVTDIDRVRAFDAKTGAPHHELVLPGATFVNDIAAGPDGSLYVSDSGLKPDFSASGTDTIYKITSGKAKALARGKELGNPNGVLPAAGGTWVVSFGSGELYWISDKGKRENIQKLPKGKNDGIVALADGTLLITSWEGSVVMTGKSGATFVDLVSGVESPADIGFDTKRSRLLIPLFTKNSLVFHKLEASPATATP
jgi:sugar lactone lactonase YvrE